MPQHFLASCTLPSPALSRGQAAMRAEHTLFQLYHMEKSIAARRKEIAQLRKTLAEKNKRIVRAPLGETAGEDGG